MNTSESRMLVQRDSLDSYVRSISAIPFLTQQEEYDLAVKFRDEQDLSAAKKLVLAHLRFVVSIAKGYMGYGLPLSDLIQEGTVGLMKAVKKFDVSQGVRLAAFAVHWIKAEINDYVIKNWRLVKVATTKAQRKLFFKLKQAKKHIGWFSNSEVKSVASEFGVTEKDVTEMESRLSSNDYAYDNVPNDDSEENCVSASDFLVDEHSNFSVTLEDNNSRKLLYRQLNNALGSLDERSYYIIKSRWLDENKLTLSEIAEQLHVSLERVRQLEKVALDKIKKGMQSSEDLLSSIE